MSAPIPDGWAAVQLDDIAEVRLGRQRSPKNHTGDSMVPYLRAANVTWDGIDVSDVKAMNFTAAEVETYRLRPGDLVLSEASGSAGEVGKPGIWRAQVEGDVCFQNTLLRVRAEEGVDPEFLYYRLLHECLRGGFARTARGVGIHHLGAGNLAGLRLALPGPDEQRRLVSTLSRGMEQLTVAEAGVNRLARRISLLRENVLVRACSGQLVPQDPADVPARDLLSTALEDGYHCAEEDLPAVPRSWAWAALGDIAEVVGGVTKDSKKQHAPGMVEVPYLRVANVQRNRLRLDDVACIRVTPAKLDALRLQPGDVLMNEGGDRDKLGRGWIWEGQLEDCIHQNHVFRARVRGRVLDPRLLSWHGNTFGQRWFESVGKQTTNLASLSLTNVRRLPVPIPPANEQARIVSEVERQLSILDSMEAGLIRLRSANDALRRALLSAAFEGRLSDPGHSHTGVTELLERIKATRAALTTARSPRRRTVRGPRDPSALDDVQESA